MNCFDCKKPTLLIVDFLDFDITRSEFETVLKCPRCNATFFGTFYRDLNQANDIVDCKECEEKKKCLITQ